MLEVRSLTVTLPGLSGNPRVLDDISFSVEAGQTLALVGESGCGKSVTALAMMRLLPAAMSIQGGDVLLDGHSVFALSESAMQSVRGARMAMIFQEPSTSLNPVMRIADQIAEVIALHGKSRGDCRERVIELLGEVGIDDPQRRADAFPFELSGGQKQRVMIAMALAGEPEVIIADEPTTALDVTLQAQILDLLERLKRERNLALVLITHDLALVSRYADRVCLMYAGSIVESAPATEFFSRPAHPYARKLLESVPSQGLSDRMLLTIPGTVPEIGARPAGCPFSDRCDMRESACKNRPGLQDIGLEHRVRCPLYRKRLPERNARRIEANAFGLDPILTVQGLSVGFERSGGIFSRRVVTPVLRDVSLTVHSGETLALVGESGSGKTTLGKTVLGLLPETAEVRGQVRLGQINALGARGNAVRDLRRCAQIIFQDPFSSLDPRMSVGESIAEGIRELVAGLTESQVRQRVDALLARVGLPGSADRLPGEFSGGQRQRVAIARALAVEPRLIICDEPTSALDVSVQAQILNLLRELQRETGVAYLFITHNFSVVEYMADRVAVMRHGRLVEMGPVLDVLNHPREAYTKALLKAVPRFVSHND